MGCVTPNALRCRCNGRRPQFRDHPQNVCKEIFGNGDFGHLKRDMPAMADDLRADLDELLFQARQRPLLDRLRRRQRAQKVAEIVSERMELKTNRVGSERERAMDRLGASRSHTDRRRKEACQRAWTAHIH
jgi:hypothetical protein